MPGKQMSYTFNSDSTYSASVWYVTRIEDNPEQKTLFARIDGWSSQDSKDAGESPIANKSYSISSTDYDTYFAESVLDDADKTTVTQIFVYADVTLDSNNNTESFFDSASDI